MQVNHCKSSTGGPLGNGGKVKGIGRGDGKEKKGKEMGVGGGGLEEM